jgi:hypothetical protein
MCNRTRKGDLRTHALFSRPAPPVALHKSAPARAERVRSDFVREGELNRWVNRFQVDPEGWLVAKGVAIAIRRRMKPGERIGVRQLCYLTGLHWKTVMAALYRMRESGRLRFSKISEDFDSSFLFAIPSTSEEEAWMRQKQSPGPKPVNPTACRGVKVKRLRPGRALGVTPKEKVQVSSPPGPKTVRR